MEFLLSSSEIEDSHGGHGVKLHRIRPLIECAVKYSVFAPDASPELSNSSASAMKVKTELLDSGSNPSSSDPMAGSKRGQPLKGGRGAAGVAGYWRRLRPKELLVFFIR